MIFDIEDDDLGLYCSFDEYIEPYISELQQAMFVRKNKDDLDTVGFLAYNAVLNRIDQKFDGLEKVKSEYCANADECDAHDGRLIWERQW